MFFIINKNQNPYFNLALEEYLLGLKINAIMLWQNEKSIIVGCNQNTSLEVNEEFAINNNIKIARRITGGGAVYHDKGNVNYTIISSNTSNIGNYDAFTLDLRDFLASLGLNPTLSGRNDILINNKKICGNAQAIKNNMFIHHGCILFSSNTNELSQALNVNELKYESKGIKSVKSRVTTIKENINCDLSANDFIKNFSEYLIKKHNLEIYNLKDNDISAVNKLVKEKYETYEWIFGNSPEYNFRNVKKTKAGVIEANLNIINGYINNAKVYGDFFNKQDLRKLESKIIGLKHSKEELTKSIKNINEFILEISDEEFIDLLTNKK